MPERQHAPGCTEPSNHPYVCLTATDKPDELAPHGEHVWIGDLSGFQLWGDVDGLLLEHRCGWERPFGNHDYLGNIVIEAMGHRARTCAGEGTPR